MNDKMKTTLMFVLVMLVVSACGSLNSASVSVDTPEPVTTIEVPTIAPTVVPVENTGPVMAERYVGLIYSSLPNSLLQGFSMIIQDSNEYGLSLVIDGANKMLWLEKVSSYDKNGQAIWEVKDVLDLSTFEAGLILIPDGCLVNGVHDSEVFVVSKNGVIVMAWRANTTTGQFEIAPIQGVSCDSDKSMIIN